MPLELGAAFAPRRVEIIDVEEPRQIDVEALRSEQLLVALEALREALTTMPAPVVNVSEPDLTAIVQAVTQLKGPATADEIARAVVNEISPGGEPGMDTVLVKLTDALDKLDFRMQGLGSGGGGVGVSDINDRATRVLGKVDVTSTPGLTDEQIRATPLIVDGSVTLDPGTSVLTTSLLNRKVAEGKVFFTGKAIAVSNSTGLSSVRASFKIENPALLPDGVTANTKTLFVFLISIYSDVSQQIRYREGATMTTPNWLTPRGWNRRLPQHPAAVGKVAWSTEAPTGGTTLDNESRVFNTSPLGLQFPAPYEIAPGMSFTVDFQGAATQITTANGYWYEEG